MDHIEALVCKWLIKRIRKGYGCDCLTYDLDDFKGDKKIPSRCASCEASDIIKWLERHINLLESY